jgi:hypothetical protein
MRAKKGAIVSSPGNLAGWAVRVSYFFKSGTIMATGKPQQEKYRGGAVVLAIVASRPISNRKFRVVCLGYFWSNEAGLSFNFNYNHRCTQDIQENPK